MYDTKFVCVCIACQQRERERERAYEKMIERVGIGKDDIERATEGSVMV